MLLKIKNPERYKEIDIDVEFPFFRLQIVDEDHDIYYRFDSIHKAMVMETKMSSTVITIYDDPDIRYPVTADIFTEDMLASSHSFVEISEKTFMDEYHKFIASLTKHLSI